MTTRNFEVELSLLKERIYVVGIVGNVNDEIVPIVYVHLVALDYRSGLRSCIEND